MKIFEGKNVPIKSWCNNPEEGAIEQARDLASLPFIYRQVNLMADTHQGYGMPIGGVIGLKGVVIPNAVGVDIGCGMIAVKTSLTKVSQEKLKKIFSAIRKKVPVGFKHHKEKHKEELMPRLGINPLHFLPIVSKEFESARKQLGTLGGGNHFIEVQKDDDGHIWIMVHSGSRNLGYKVAKHYNKVAQELCNKWYSPVPKDLSFLPLDTKEGQTYLKEMDYCLRFAYANRQLMIKRIKESFKEHLFVNFEPEINIHHNYATMENHFGKNVMVHRKGATSAKEGEIGIIPGSQGTASYIVKGKGNKESFMSCSHGAGRKMSRTKARHTLDLKEEQEKLESKGILHSIRGNKSLGEASSAYKDIDVVMQEQKDLVEILVKLKPLGVIKG